MRIFKRAVTVLAIALFATSLVPLQAQAQWGIGASYEIRDVEPKNGFGVRIERDIFQKLPIVDLGIRAHFSNFSEKNSVSTDGNITYSREIQDYDYGITALGGVNVGLVKPYVGLGLGSNTVDVQRSDLPQDSPLEADANESKIYWNALVGAEISAIPLLKPFVEYRYTNVGEDFFESVQEQNVPAPSDSNGRIIFGVLLKF